MPIDLSPFLDPKRCAVVVFECQENVIGAGSQIPGLVAALEQGKVLENIARLLDRARDAGAAVFYCTADNQLGGLGRAQTPMTDRIQRAAPGASGPVDTSVVKAIAPEPGDILLTRGHGMTAFYKTELDPCLRDLGTTTVIPVGVSLNIGVLGTTVEAVNHGYRVIVPRDCVAGDPPEYGEQVLQYTIRNLAYVSSTDEIAQIWSTLAAG